MFDLVFLPNAFVDNPEARQRADELDPLAFYTLRLRAPGVPFQPVYIDAAPQGVHGRPVCGKWPTLIVIRDPHPTVYSYFHTATERWGSTIPDRIGWMRRVYRQYREFYDAALGLAERDPARTLLIRFEALTRDPAILADVVRFVGVRPKLSPEFVFWRTNFERMTRPGPRTFYRSGNNERWRADEAWKTDVAKANPGDFSRYGYPADGSLPPPRHSAFNFIPSGIFNRARHRLRRWWSDV